MTDWPDRCNTLLSDCSIIDVVAIKIKQFETQFGTGPSLLILSRSLKGPLIREVFQASKATADVQVAEPVWINQLPLIFRNMGDTYLRVANNRIGKELTL